MHPIIILIPVMGLALAPRWWAERVLKKHNQGEGFSLDAAQLTRIWLDRNQLQEVRIEVTDLGDHYDPETRTIRLSRDKHARKTLSAVTTAAHEVAHALQDFEDYGPFIWRNRLARFAGTAGQAGSLILLSVPAAALLGRRPLPPLLLGSTVWVMLGSGMLAQYSALISEVDASFKRALPLLQEVIERDEQLEQARRILLACSLTYAASSLLSVLHFWPWWSPYRPLLALRQSGLIGAVPRAGIRPQAKPSLERGVSRAKTFDTALRQGSMQGLVRTLGKPVIRAWLRCSRAALGVPASTLNPRHRPNTRYR